MKRNQRICAIMNVLTTHPNMVFSYNYFTDRFDAAKTSISEDIVIIKETINDLDLGEIQTISGAAGGVKYIPKVNANEEKKVVNLISEMLNSKERILPGNFIYMVDMLYNPGLVDRIAKIFVNQYENVDIDYVVTVETKGIPLAFETARLLNVPLVIIRRNIKITEGTTVNINYISGSSGSIQTMSLSRKAMKENSKVLVVDDFMKAGGTAKGIVDMMKEFKSKVEGICVLMSTAEPKDKLVDDYYSLLTLEKIDNHNGEIYIKAGNSITTTD